MNDLRQEKIKELVTEHNLPPEILNQIVDEVGGVDNVRLGIALQTRHFVQSGATTQNRAEILTLTEQYYQAADRRDTVQMVVIKSKIYGLGGRMEPRQV